jgi:hypothetical protein
MDHDTDLKAATLDLEERGILTSLDKSVEPTMCLRKVPEKNRIRRGCAKSIRLVAVDSDDEAQKNVLKCRVDFVRDNAEPLWFTKEHIFVNFTSPGPFNKKDANNRSPFSSDGEIRLTFLFSPPGHHPASGAGDFWIWTLVAKYWKLGMVLTRRIPKMTFCKISFPGMDSQRWRMPPPGIILCIMPRTPQ